MTRKTWIILIILAVVLLVPALFVMASEGPTNPPVERQVDWDSPQTKELFYRACADCHSNETKWPWYAKVPPASWLVIHDVNEGREKFNISALDMGEADDAAEAVIEGEMPLKIYLPLHPEARLSDAEKQALAEGLQKTFGGEGGEAGESDEHEKDDDD